MYRDVGEYTSLQSENAEYRVVFVQNVEDFFATDYLKIMHATKISRV